MLARRLPGLLPSLEQDEALEVTQVFSAAGLLGPDAGLISVRPFRAPHHAISVPGLVRRAVPGPARCPLPITVSCSSRMQSSPGPPAAMLHPLALVVSPSRGHEQRASPAQLRLCGGQPV